MLWRMNIAEPINQCQLTVLTISVQQAVPAQSATLGRYKGNRNVKFDTHFSTMWAMCYILSSRAKSKFQLIIGVFAIAFAMSMVE